ncbi:MAG: phosphoribosyl-AMP cyclohydrolase [Anaerolineae bacterium]|nr:phosphoribosyl-AMP cyclohydrolase [Anaerolineae bacterium]
MIQQKIEPQRLEEGSELLLDFNKLKKVAQARAAVLPVVVQHADTREVLLIGYANETALNYTLAHRVAAFWSTSRDELWIKGATSGDTLAIVEIRVNCEQNSLLYLVKPLGVGACHTKNAAGKARLSCYYRRIKQGQLEFVTEQERDL